MELKARVVFLSTTLGHINQLYTSSMQIKSILVDRMFESVQKKQGEESSLK